MYMYTYIQNVNTMILKLKFVSKQSDIQFLNSKRYIYKNVYTVI